MRYQLILENLSCQHCVARVKTALEQVDGVQSVVVTLESQEVVLTSDRAHSLADYQQALADTVYEIKEWNELVD